MDKRKIWDCLRRRRIPAWVLSLISGLYTNTESAIKTVGKTKCGISLGEATIIDHDFANHVLIFAETLEVIMHALDILSMECLLDED